MKKYIDFQSGAGLGENSGIFAGIFGRDTVSEANVWMAINNTWERYGMHTYTYPTEIRQEYERRLCEWAGYEACALFSDGTTAVEAALRVMRSDGNYTPISAIWDGFHGKSLGALESLERIELDYPSLLAFQRKSKWIVEGYRGWDAQFWPDWFVDILKASDMVCFDEIQSGFGRTGKKFAFEHYGIKPDLIVTGKGQGGGFPVSAVLGPRELLSNVDLTCTHGGNPLACAAGLGTLDEIERLNLIEESARKGHILHDRLAGLGVPVNGRGMVAALMFESVTGADRLVKRCQENGLLVVRTGKGSVKLGPPLTIPDEELIRGVEIIGGCL